MRAILVMALKDLRLLWRDRMGLFWVLAFPLIYATAFGAIIGGGLRGGTGRMNVAIADEDGTAGSQALVARLRESAALNVQDVDRNAARDAVRRGKLTAYIVVHQGFGDALGMMGGGESLLEVGIDPARRAEAGMLQGIVTEAAFRQLQDQFSDPAKMRTMLDKSLKSINADADMSPVQRLLFQTFLGSVDTFLDGVDPQLYQQGPQMKAFTPQVTEVAGQQQSRPRSGFEITFPSAIMWGVMGCTATFAISLVVERTGGTLQRLRVAPLSRSQILAGKGLACFLTCLGVVVLLLAVGVALFGVRLSNPAGVALAAVCTAFAFVGLMMLMCVLGKTEQAVSGAGWAILIIVALLGGGMIPLIFMPAWMQTLSHVSPVNWGIVALEGAIWRDFTLRDMLEPCGLLTGFGALCFAIGVRVLGRAED